MKNKPSILYAPAHFRFSDKLGSEYNESYELINNIKNTELYEQTIITGNNEITPKKSFPNVLEVWKHAVFLSTNDFGIKNSLVFNIKYTIELIKQLYFSNKKFDLLHHIRPFSLYTTFNFGLIFNFKKIPVIVGPFATPYNSLGKGLISKIIGFLNIKTLQSADVVLVNEKYTKKLVEDFSGIQNVMVLPVGKNFDSFNYIPKNYDKNEFKFLSSGHLIDRKNFEFLIHTFASAVHKSTKKITLDIVGDGELRDKLQKLIFDLNMQNHIRLMGKIQYSEMESYYQSSDYFIISQKQEAFAHVFIGASAYGLPTITTKTIASQSIIEPYGGVVVEQGNNEGFCKEILRLVSNPTLSKKLSSDALEYANSNFDWEKILLPKLLVIYNNLIKDKNEIQN